jgi:transcriptional/translational regulatory protein YebC/TACO1
MGRSLSGAALEKVMLEVVMPGGIAMVVEMETDSKGRTMQEVSHVVKKTGGKLGSTLFYFDHYGRVTLDADAARSREEDLFQFVLEEKALDLDIPVAGESEVEEDAVVWTKPGETAKVAKLLKHELGLQARSVDLVWRPNNDMKASLQSDQEATFLNQVLVALQDFPEVNATFVSVERGKASPAMWETIQENIIFR